uniref:Uncharacterized protein n=1 Tax=Romanomermis culicivorax TaxID=13658 RepID=A0A915KXE3_ROMCU
MEKMGVTTAQKAKALGMLWQNGDVFSLPNDKPTFTNELTIGMDTRMVKPVAGHYYCMAMEQRPIIRHQIQEMIENNFIRSPGSTCTVPLFLIKEKGRQIRHCNLGLLLHLALYLTLLDLELIRNGAHNLIYCLDSQDIIGNSCGSAIKLFKSVAHLGAEVLDFRGIGDGDTASLIATSAWAATGASSGLRLTKESVELLGDYPSKYILPFLSHRGIFQ